MLFFGNASEAFTPGPVQMLVLLALLWFALGRLLQRGHLQRWGRALRNLTGLVFLWVWVFSTPALASLALTQLEGDAYLPSTPDSPEPLYLVPALAAQWRAFVVCRWAGQRREPRRHQRRCGHGQGGDANGCARQRHPRHWL